MRSAFKCASVRENLNLLHANNNGHVRMQGGGGGQGDQVPTLKITKNGFLSNTGPDPLKITKLQSQGVSLAGRRWPTYSGI